MAITTRSSLNRQKFKAFIKRIGYLLIQDVFLAKFDLTSQSVYSLLNILSVSKEHSFLVGACEQVSRYQ
jgi:hypothetical protein